jgi:hypothetical protein
MENKILLEELIALLKGVRAAQNGCLGVTRAGHDNPNWIFVSPQDHPFELNDEWNEQGTAGGVDGCC